LLDIAQLRIGGREYARDNGSFGATTLRKRHAQVSGQKLKLQFRAKSGKEAVYLINDRVLVRVVRRCQELPGQTLFSYRDEAGELRAVSSQDVNAYLKDAMGDQFTAKDFRTWGASLIAYEVLNDARTAKQAGATFKQMLVTVAEALGNTPAMARKAYIHPRLIAMAKDGNFIPGRAGRMMRHLSRAERGLIALLETPEIVAREAG
jgi:DNA topoisomerase I